MKSSDGKNKEGFYRAFEDKHRGSRDLIKGRLAVYLPFVEPLRDFYQPASAIDLGCGRGEWLEILLEKQFKPLGVDLDSGMLSACAARGLPATHGDAVAYLRALDDESQCVVSGFHVAEHLAFDDLKTLVIESFRVLLPGGLLILETPNPENLVVGSSNFYLDPTHQRPIPPMLLAFLPKHVGFARVCTVRLQESVELRKRTDIRLMDVLGGVSPDYAIVAQKAASPEVTARFDAVFDAHYGMELHELADRYDGALGRRMTTVDTRLSSAEAQVSGMADKLSHIAAMQDRLIESNTQFARMQANVAQLQALVQELEKRIDELSSDPHHTRQGARTSESERKTIGQSTLLRDSSPLRFAAGLAVYPLRMFRVSANFIVHRSICIMERPLSYLMVAVLRRPRISHQINSWLLKYPALYQQLIGVAHRGGIAAGGGGYTVGDYFQSYKKSSENRVKRKLDTSRNFYLDSSESANFEHIDVETALQAIRLDLKEFRGGE